MNEYKRKLTDEQVAMMRSQAAHGVNHRDLSDRFDIAQSQVSRIVRGELYADTPGPITVAKMPIKDRHDPMAWYSSQGLTWADARDRYRMIQRRRRVA